MKRAVETDVCIVGSGITAALLAAKLADETSAHLTVVEAGDEVVDPARRAALRQRYLWYGETPWPNDHVQGMTAAGIQSRSMMVGGLAMHWGGVTPRFSPEDFSVRSLYGVGHDWPISYDDLDAFYQEAEERMGVAGEQGPPALDPRGKPYPLPPLPLTYNLGLLKGWAAKAGIATWSQPSAKTSVAYRGRPPCCRNDTCYPICPIGAKYSPDVTWRALRAAGKVDLIPRTIVRRLVAANGSTRIEKAVALDRDRPDDDLELYARTFVVAAGYVWSSHLLLLSANDRFPNGIANSSGLVGRYLTGHRNVSAFIQVPFRLYPGMNEQHSLVSKQFMRPGPITRYVRHDFRIWESSFGAAPRLKDDGGGVLLGDELLADWRRRTERGTARVRAYYDVVPGASSRLTLDPTKTTPWGDPLPRIAFADGEESVALRGYTEETILQRFQDLARVAGGHVLRTNRDSFQDHPAGGCRMGDHPASSVVNNWGRTHDHENLFVVGAPTCVSGGCANGTLTFVALGLRAAAEIGRDA